MKTIFVRGQGTVSPAGWGTPSFCAALAQAEPLPIKELARPGWEKPCRMRGVPTPSSRPGFVSHARLRRTSPIAHYAVASALEALGADAEKVTQGGMRLAIVLCAMSGCVNYSRRFYDETLKNPSTASPLVFPETVFNAPSSHLAALLGTKGINYTLVGDPGTFLQGIALGADWLVRDEVEGVLVVGAEEMDWLTVDATRLFSSQAVVSEGAGALYLKSEAGLGTQVQLELVTEPHLFTRDQDRLTAARQARKDLGPNGPGELLCGGPQGIPRLDQDEHEAWKDWAGERLSIKQWFGEGYMAAAAWQCVAAVEALKCGKFKTAVVSVVGCNEQAIAARFGVTD